MLSPILYIISSALIMSTFAAITRVGQGVEGAGLHGADSDAFRLSSAGQEGHHPELAGSIPFHREEILGDSPAQQVKPADTLDPEHLVDPSSTSSHRNVEQESTTPQEAPEADAANGIAQRGKASPNWRDHVVYIANAGAMGLATSQLAMRWAPAAMLEEQGILSTLVTVLVLRFHYWKH
ncbi:hypothetical protein PGT21_009750 [Puccinia graminis f. sp. tritici]|uniref:Uncharacterized protein n=1 Tax=Puccinia graminis f. sp. tritici TaxID=56615 RepID=A0A5B0Q227_PUCGR|nr:hypothetical protein PGT21_009750 [Puccinia graminis f. sp. tritici]KAA1124888.1 hypothetical protein PGTUg99_036425 [Puccinia graminis f. sp. tritici]